jgi:hypothetical protein
VQGSAIRELVQRCLREVAGGRVGVRGCWRGSGKKFATFAKHVGADVKAVALRAPVISVPATIWSGARILVSA